MYHIATTMEISKAMEISMGLNFGYRMEFSMGHGNFHGGPYFKFQDHGNFHGVWKFPWESLFHLRRAVSICAADLGFQYLKYRLGVLVIEM